MLFLEFFLGAYCRSVTKRVLRSKLRSHRSDRLQFAIHLCNEAKVINGHVHISSENVRNDRLLFAWKIVTRHGGPHDERTAVIIFLILVLYGFVCANVRVELNETVAFLHGSFYADDFAVAFEMLKESIVIDVVAEIAHVYSRTRHRHIFHTHIDGIVIKLKEI